ncbi:MAG: 16S rRNA (uracil(1498)-N(3))-methyltransferase [Candidatus Marinimicrobia bacterium]|nr:16S rRNA (uracil(1498)-N(3))-methyltransferase [Candidatus Neomarinimicrobiota bacterium]
MHQYSFYVLPDKINENTAILTGDDFRHCIQVLRKKIGDEVSLVDGRGNIFHSTIQECTKTACTCRILSRETHTTDLNIKIILGFGLVKAKALELIIRDATALGVHSIVPLQTTHSIKQRLNADRAHKIAVESIKQSGNCYLPKIERPQSLAAWFKGLNSNVVKIVCDQESDGKLSELLSDSGSVKSIAVLVGPEGGLCEDELKMVFNAGFVSINLNPFRLRTELAVVAAISSICSLMK